jgi:putative ABC transport system ATP-binding protein
MRRVQREQKVSFIFSTHDPQLMSEAEVTFAIRDGVLANGAEEQAA